MRSVIRLIETTAELEAVQRQRYETYVKTMGFRDPYADTKRAAIIEPLDDTGHVFGAFDGTRLIASVRVNYGTASANGGFGEYAKLQAMHRFGAYFPHRLSMVTRLVIDPSYRASTLMARMGIALFEHTRDTRPDTAFCLIDCVPALKGLFLRIGYQQIGAAFAHPTVGPVLPMAFAVYGLAHFRHVRSPLVGVCPRNEHCDTDWFERTFGDELRIFAESAVESRKAYACRFQLA